MIIFGLAPESLFGLAQGNQSLLSLARENRARLFCLAQDLVLFGLTKVVAVWSVPRFLLQVPGLFGLAQGLAWNCTGWDCWSGTGLPRSGWSALT